MKKVIAWIKINPHAEALETLSVNIGLASFVACLFDYHPDTTLLIALGATGFAVWVNWLADLRSGWSAYGH